MDSEMATKYALMKYIALNIGDVIQSVAAQRFLPRVDAYVYRERIDKFSPDSGVKHKVILNNHWMHNPKHFPPSEYVDPLLVSMSFSRRVRPAISSNKKAVQYLKDHGPVGCRDTDTVKFLESCGVPAYQSGCLTLTLTPNKAIKTSEAGKYVLCVDVSDNICEYVRKHSSRPVYVMTKQVNPYPDSMERFTIAKAYLYIYHNAGAVITTNLHTALPCIAFNTPVCLIDHKKRDGRFDGLDTLTNHYTDTEFIAGAYDVDNPPANPEGYRVFRDSLIETCRNFTGYDSEMPTFEDNYRPDIIALIQTMADNLDGPRRNMAVRVLMKAIAYRLTHLDKYKE